MLVLAAQRLYNWLSKAHTVSSLARRAERLESLKAEIVSKGGSAEVLVGDLDQRDATVAAVAAKLSEGPIHILINNAGGPKGGPILNAAEEEFT